LRRVACFGAVGAACLGAAAPAAQAAQREVRLGAAPALPQGTTLVAGIAAVRTMKLSVALEPRDPAALSRYAAGVGNPSSPDYRHYLTPGQFRDRFAPTRRTVLRVQDSLRRHGLTAGAVSANGLAIGVSGTGAAVQRAFNLTLASVRLPDGRDALYNSQAPALDARIAPDVQAVVGLSSLARMQRLDVRHSAADFRRGTVAPRIGSHRPPPNHPRGARTSSAHVSYRGPHPCVTAARIAPGQDAYTANQIAAAYGFSSVYAQGDEGQGVTIGVYELEPNAPSDITAYQRCYGTHVKISYQQVDSGAGKGTGQGEAALDIEQLIGLAPQAKLIVYQGPNNQTDNPGTGPYDVLAAMVSQDKVQVISNSWGECESLEGTSDAHAENTLLQEAATQGQTFVSAAGDSGSEDCYVPPPGGNTNNSLAVDDPGSQIYATSVGGTSISSIGPPLSEVVWNDDNPNINYSRFGIQPGAGGGGISTFWQMPPWQAAAPAALAVKNADSSGTPCAAPAGTYCRELPDVSAAADPMTSYLDYWNGVGSQAHAPTGWQGTGGTSGAAPVWAALFALADAYRGCRGTQVGFADPTLYALAGKSQATYFNDITSGNNDFTPDGNNSGLYPATAGYDMASGLGTPKAAALVPALCRQSVRVDYPGAVYTFYGQHVRLRVHAHRNAGEKGPLHYRALRLPAGVHINHRTGVISGRVTRAGIRIVTVTASSASHNHGAMRFTWSTERRPRLAAAFRGAGGQLALSLVASSGAYEPGLRDITVRLPHSLTLALPSRDIKVEGIGGADLRHAARFGGGVLTVVLHDAHSPVRILFGPGTLRALRPITGPVTLSVRTIDRLGGRTTLPRQLRGA